MACHIVAEAGGHGARRVDLSLTKEQRSAYDTASGHEEPNADPEPSSTAKVAIQGTSRSRRRFDVRTQSFRALAIEQLTRQEPGQSPHRLAPAHLSGRFVFIIAPARDDHILGGQKLPADLKPVRRAIDAALPLRPAWDRDIKAVTVARGRADVAMSENRRTAGGCAGARMLTRRRPPLSSNPRGSAYRVA
jgi:hypothetical protein